MQNKSDIPRHVAIIPDGNGRWAQQRGLPRLEGHRAGVKNIRKIVSLLQERGVNYTTFYAFSTENWRRPQNEINGLIELIDEAMKDEATYLHESNIVIHHIGNREGLSKTLLKSIDRVVKLTSKNTGMHLGIAFNYGGRAEIIEATRRIMQANINPDDINEELFTKYLDSAGFPDVDLVIRTGGEYRISNFLIWQSVYAEYYFTPVFWPDFNKDDIENALQEFSQRQRRFGGLSPEC